MNWKNGLFVGAGAALSVATANVADATIRVDDGKVYLTEYGKTVQVPATPALLDAIQRAGGGIVALPNAPEMLMSSGGGSSFGFGVAPDPATQRAIDDYLKTHPEAARQKSAESGTAVRHRDGEILMSSGGGASLGFGVAPDPATQRAIEEYLKTHPQDSESTGPTKTASTG